MLESQRTGLRKDELSKMQAARLLPRLLQHRDRLGCGHCDLGKEVAQVHLASPGVLVGTNVFSTNASKRGSLRIGSQAGSSL